MQNSGPLNLPLGVIEFKGANNPIDGNVNLQPIDGEVSLEYSANGGLFVKFVGSTYKFPFLSVEQALNFLVKIFRTTETQLPLPYDSRRFTEVRLPHLATNFEALKAVINKLFIFSCSEPPRPCKRITALWGTLALELLHGSVRQRRLVEPGLYEALVKQLENLHSKASSRTVLAEAFISLKLGIPPRQGISPMFPYSTPLNPSTGLPVAAPPQREEDFPLRAAELLSTRYRQFLFDKVLGIRQFVIKLTDFYLGADTSGPETVTLLRTPWLTDWSVEGISPEHMPLAYILAMAWLGLQLFHEKDTNSELTLLGNRLDKVATILLNLFGDIGNKTSLPPRLLSDTRTAIVLCSFQPPQLVAVAKSMNASAQANRPLADVLPRDIRNVVAEYLEKQKKETEGGSYTILPKMQGIVYKQFATTEFEATIPVPGHLQVNPFCTFGPVGVNQLKLRLPLGATDWLNPSTTKGVDVVHFEFQPSTAELNRIIAACSDAKFVSLPPGVYRPQEVTNRFLFVYLRTDTEGDGSTIYSPGSDPLYCTVLDNVNCTCRSPSQTFAVLTPKIRLPKVVEFLSSELNQGRSVTSLGPNKAKVFRVGIVPQAPTEGKIEITQDQLKVIFQHTTLKQLGLTRWANVKDISWSTKPDPSVPGLEVVSWTYNVQKKVLGKRKGSTK